MIEASFCACPRSTEPRYAASAAIKEFAIKMVAQNGDLLEGFAGCFANVSIEYYQHWWHRVRPTLHEATTKKLVDQSVSTLRQADPPTAAH